MESKILCGCVGDGYKIYQISECTGNFDVINYFKVAKRCGRTFRLTKFIKFKKLNDAIRWCKCDKI